MAPLALAALCWAALARPAAAGGFVVGAFLRPPPGRRAALERRAVLASDPGAEEYGSYLSQAEMAEAVGLPAGTAQKVAQWMASALDSLQEPRVLAHRDVVSLAAPDFWSTYRLGARLAGACPECAGEQLSVQLPPDAIELLVTPPMPPHFCKGFTESGESACNLHAPCKWVKKAKSKAKCKGDFSGWICWPETAAGITVRWRCFEPAEFTAGDASLARRRRRGRHWPGAGASSGHSAKGGQPPAASEDPAPQKETTLGFRVLPKSEGLELLFKKSDVKQGNTSMWHSLEITLRQDSMYRTQVLRRGDFEARGPHLLSGSVRGVANLRPVDGISVCLHEADADVEPKAIPSLVTLANAEEGGCHCDGSGTDRRLGRRCARLPGLSPAKRPVDFVLPRGPQTLSALQRDLGVSPWTRTVSGATQAVAEFSDEAFMQQDVVTLHHAFGLRPPAGKIGVQGPDGLPGGRDDYDTAGEGSLDAQVITTLAPGSPTTWVAVDPYCMDGFMLAYAAHLNHHSSPPLVHSVSWGDAEALFPPQFIQRLDYELMKLALRGLSVIIASGDNGISSTTAECAFVPDVVGSSPWVTSVGATLPSLAAAPYCGHPGFSSLGVCEEPGPITCATAAGAIITSSGYWSVYRPRPSYQDAAVSAYVQGAPCNPCKTGNSQDEIEEGLELNVPCQHISDEGCRLGPMIGTRRGAPDVAAPGNSYPVIVNGSLGLMDGTSASAPAFAAMVSLLNSEQLSKGRPPLGFLNPWLYQTHQRHPEAFADVVVGDTGSTEEHLCAYGWRAGPGWDLATGLGVPRFSKLREYLPEQGRQPTASAAAAAAVAESPGADFGQGDGGLVAAKVLAGSCFALAAAALGAAWRSSRLPWLQGSAAKSTLPSSVARSLLRS